jgi:DNA-binding NtrC family response regulator
MRDAAQPPQILVVDDEVVIADTMTAILRMNGARALAAYSAESAFQIALELKPDILISDIIMGEMSGIDLAIRLSTEIPDCRLILISGQSASTDLPAETARKGYRFEFLEKPISPQRLLTHIGLPTQATPPHQNTKAA